MEEPTRPAAAPILEPPTVEEKKDLLDAVLDLSFRTAITPKIIRWLYILGLIGSALWTGRWVMGSFAPPNGGIMSGLVSLVFAPIIFLIGAVVTRVTLEIVQAVFGIAASLKNMERYLK